MTGPAPRAIGPYRIERELGRGGMGIVLLARDARLGRLVALKRLPAELADDPDRLSRFEREARIVASLNHPNIVVIHSFEEAEGLRFVTMEYIEGESLSARIRPGGLPLSEALDLIVPVTDALAAAHAKGIVHRDLKPANVMVGADGRVKVLDFGLAKVRASDAATAAHGSDSVTGTGIVVGTVPYMSPETLRGEEASPRSDLFAVGVLLHELLAGRRPFSGETPVAVATAILRDDPAPLDAARPDLPAGLSALVARALAKDPRDRPPTAMAFGDALARWRDASGAAPAPGRRRRFAAPARAETPPPSVAVLPFANLSSDPENEYFADGLSEELLSVLSRVRGLRVAARTSSFQFKGQTGDVGTIAKRLRVATVLEGSVRKAGRRVRISANLVHGSDGYPIWSESYDRELEDIFAVQDSIAQHVVQELRAALLGESIEPSRTDAIADEVRAAAHGRGENADAYELYLQGRHFIDRFTEGDVARGADLVRQALALQPEYALAWAALARAHATQAGYGWTPVEEGFEQARLAAERALALDPDLADALAVLGRVRLVYDRNASAAEGLYRRALELAPRDTFIVRAAAVLARNAGRLDEAIGLLGPAVENDPLNEPAHFGLALCCYWAGDLEEAEESFRRARGLNPNGAATSFYLAAVQAALGRPEEAAATLALEPLEIFRLLGAVLLAEAAGSRDASGAALNELRERFAEEAAYQIATAHALRGERDEAFTWLERALEQRDSGLAELKPDIHMKPLRSDPRWAVFLERVERGV